MKNAILDQEDGAQLTDGDISTPSVLFNFKAKKGEDVELKTFSGFKLERKTLMLDYGPTCRFEGLEIVLDVGENFCRIQWREEPSTEVSAASDGVMKL